LIQTVPKDGFSLVFKKASKDKLEGSQKALSIGHKKSRTFLDAGLVFLSNCSQYTAGIPPRPNLISFV